MRKNYDRGVSANTLYVELKKIAENKGIDFDREYKSALSLAKHITAIMSDLNEFIKANHVVDRRRRTTYYFAPTSARTSKKKLL